MPIYPYRCEACGKSTEVWAKMSDPPPESCPHCGGGPLSRAVARTAFHLKGGGWYAQGYGAAGGGAKSGGASEGKGGESASGESKSGEAKSSEPKSSESQSSSATGDSGGSAKSTPSESS